MKAISRIVRILILDEPTTALSGGEVEKLFAFLRKLKSDASRSRHTVDPYDYSKLTDEQLRKLDELLELASPRAVSRLGRW